MDGINKLLCSLVSYLKRICALKSLSMSLNYKNICMYDMCKGACVNNGSEGKARYKNLTEN